MILRDASIRPGLCGGTRPEAQFMARKSSDDDEDFEGDFDDDSGDDEEGEAGAAGALSEIDKENAKPKTLISAKQTSRSSIFRIARLPQPT